MDLGLAALALGDVAVDENEPTIGNGVSPNLDDTAIWARPFIAEFLVGVFETAAEFRLDVFGAELAAFGEYTDIIGVAWTLDQNRIR